MTTTYRSNLDGSGLRVVAVTVEWSQHLASNNNMRENPYARAKRMKSQRSATKMALHFNKVREQLGEQPAGTRVLVKLTRLSTHPLDPGDNHNSSFKAVRDEIAKYFGLNDRYEDQIKFEYLPHLFAGFPTVRAVFLYEPHVAAQPAPKRTARVIETSLATTPRDWMKRGLLKPNVTRGR